MPGLTAAAIFTIRIAWNEYRLASAHSDRDTKTVPILMVNNMSYFNVEWGANNGDQYAVGNSAHYFYIIRFTEIITGMTAGAVNG